MRCSAWFVGAGIMRHGDIVATDESPLDDSSALQNITFVMKGGMTCLDD